MADQWQSCRHSFIASILFFLSPSQKGIQFPSRTTTSTTENMADSDSITLPSLPPKLILKQKLSASNPLWLDSDYPIFSNSSESAPPSLSTLLLPYSDPLPMAILFSDSLSIPNLFACDPSDLLNFPIATSFPRAKSPAKYGPRRFSKSHDNEMKAKTFCSPDPVQSRPNSKAELKSRLRARISQRKAQADIQSQSYFLSPKPYSMSSGNYEVNSYHEARNQEPSRDYTEATICDISAHYDGSSQEIASTSDISLDRLFD
jgi:hypothetical protein